MARLLPFFCEGLSGVTTEQRSWSSDRPRGPPHEVLVRGGVTEDKATLAAIEDGRVLAVSITEKKYKTRVFAEQHCNRLAQLECNGKSRNMVEPNERRRNETLTAKNDRRPY